MKRKQLKKISILVVMMLCSLFILRNVAQAGVTASEYLDKYEAIVEVTDTGEVKIWFEVIGTSIMDEIGATRIIVQESLDGKTWSTVKTYTRTNYPNMSASNRMKYSSSVTYQGIDENYYRAYVTIWAGKNGLGDFRTLIVS